MNNWSTLPTLDTEGAVCFQDPGEVRQGNPRPHQSPARQA